MLLSMTGFGDARNQDEQLNVAVEVRSVNNRYLKVATKCPDRYASLEGDIEKAVRGTVVRGTVSVTIRVDGLAAVSRYHIDTDAIEAYWSQLNDLAKSMQVSAPASLGNLLDLPGVVIEVESRKIDKKADWALISRTLQSALEKLREFRIEEGRSLEQDLRLNCGLITEQLEQIALLAPQVVSDYRDRLLDRVRDLLADGKATVDSTDLIREVSIFAERCDINEEITRLRSHLDQFEKILDGTTSQGRKLEFLSQEMFREVNTIGSKANNVKIAHCVVEMKGAVEKMREILQNVE